MIVAFTHSITVTVERPGGLTRFGDRLPAVSHQVRDCAFYPSNSTEDVTQRDTVVADGYLLAPYGADIKSSDIVLLPGGNRYEVDGAPGSFASPYSSWTPGMRVNLRAVTG